MGLFDRLKGKAADTAKSLALRGVERAKKATYLPATDPAERARLIDKAGILPVLEAAYADNMLSQTVTVDEHLRGTEVLDVTDGQSRQDLLQQRQPGQLQIGFVPIEFRDEWQHFLLAGAPGTGKTLTLKWMLGDIRARQEKALVYDPVGDMVSLFYRPGVDVILNPLDERDAGWNPWVDLERHELPAFAKALIPDPVGQHDPFWTHAAQAVLQALMLSTRNMDDLLNYGLRGDDATLMEIVRQAGKAGLVGQEKTFSGVRAQLSIALDKLAILHNTPAERAFSLKRWVEDDQDRRWVFLLSRKSQQEALKPLLTVWTDTVVRAALSLPPSPHRRIWLSLDEVASLGKLPSLGPALAEGRKYGLVGILGLQTVQQLRHIYGRDEAAVLYGLPRNRLILRISDQETAEEMSKELGDYQRRRVTKSYNQSVTNTYSHGRGVFLGGADGLFGFSEQSRSESEGIGISETLVTERAVMPSEIAGLPDLVGYLRTDNQVAKVCVPVPRQPWNEAQPTHRTRPQRALPWE